MFPSNSKTVWIQDFKGYSDVAIPSDNPVTSQDQSNVFTRFGRVAGRGGMAKFDSISTSSGADIIELVNYRQADGSHELLRILPTAIERWTTPTWTGITGTALTAAASNKPIYTIIDDTLIFTNEVDRPRKWAGSGNTSDVALSTAPYAKGCIAYLGFLFLFDVSDDGSFTDVFDGHRTGRYSDDWDADWAGCDGNEIVLDETPGRWMNSCVLGRTMFGIKSDGVVSVRFNTSPQRFQQDEVSSDVGMLSKKSLGVAGRTLGFFLGTDGIIYQLSQQGMKAVTYEKLHELLNNTRSLARLQHARGVIDSRNDRYLLFYDRTGLTNQRLDSWISYNYRTEEVDKGTVGNSAATSIVSLSEWQATDQAAAAILTGGPTLVHEFNSSTKDDDGVAVSGGRYWTSGWQPLAGESGWVFGARLLMTKNRLGRVAVSIALNMEETFRWKQYFDLKGGATSDVWTELEVEIPPAFVEWAKVKVEFFHDATNTTTPATTTLIKAGFVVAPTKQVGVVKSRGSGNVRAT